MVKKRTFGKKIEILVNIEIFVKKIEVSVKHWNFGRNRNFGQTWNLCQQILVVVKHWNLVESEMLVKIEIFVKKSNYTRIWNVFFLTTLDGPNIGQNFGRDGQASSDDILSRFLNKIEKINPAKELSFLTSNG